MMSHYPSVVLLLLSLAAAPFAQGRAAGQGPGPRFHLASLDQIAVVDVPAIDLESIRKEDARREVEGLPPRFAVPSAHELSPANAGTWENLDADTLLWRLRIRAPGALSLNLGFGEYEMTPGGSLHVYSADRVHVVQPFTAADNDAHGQLWTPVVSTDDLVVEVSIPAQEIDHLRLRLDWINQGYRGFGASRMSLMSGSCNVDVACPEGDDWQLEIPSVGVISTGGSTFCTGFLVNNVRQDLKPYFMTANHCGIGAGNAASLVVYWNYENSTCRPPGSPASGGAGDGSLAQFNTGSIFRSSSSASDFTLVELDDAVNPAFEVSWSGWDATGANAAQAIAIHHPNTDEKRISFEDDPTTTTTYLQEAVPGDGTHVRITDWDLGTTEPGSSGSPLYDQAHRVIGQLHGGYASCTSQTSDWYGKFSVSWNGGGTNSTRLENWLDPDSTGALVLDSVSLATLCSEEGTVALDQGSYACSDVATLLVVDCDLNTNNSVVETVTVNVSSGSEPAGEAVLLTETGPGTSRFAGTIALSGTDSAGVLWVLAGDPVTAEYVDADDGQGNFFVAVHDSAAIDCDAPNVFGVLFSNITASSATMTILVDEPALAHADHGTTCNPSPNSATGEALGWPATVELTGLLPSTTYRVHALATDEAGNATLDDNGGLCHSFDTLQVPNFFTEEYLGDNDLDNRMLVFRPAGGQDGYTLCKRTPSGLPTNPSGGTTISLTDDGSAQVNLTGGKTVELYGASYGSFHVNANGNLTFAAADGDYTESLSEHFAAVRVAALWDDLNPSAGGTVSRKQLTDRIAITWLDVPEYNTSNQNTFQIELFFDGRIRMTHLGIAVTDGITGLSAGAGLHPQFVETDLSNASTCDGTPLDDLSDTPTGPLIVIPD